MRILFLALKDLRQITRDRKSFLFLLVMPVAFTLLFGFAFSDNGETDPRLPIGLRDEDNSTLSQQLITMLEQSAVIRLEMTGNDQAELDKQVEDGDLAAAIIIPAGDAINQPITIIAQGQVGFTIEGAVQTAVSRLATAVHIADFSLAMAQKQALPANEAAAYHADALNRALRAWETPPVTIANASSGAVQSEAEAVYSDNSFAHSSPGMMAQFAIAGLMGAATILVVEKKTRTVQRLLTTNLSRGAILLGHYLAMFSLIFIQLGVLVVFGQLALKLPYFSQPVATLLMTTITALFCASLGLFIGAIANKEEHVIVLALIPMFVLSALGGAWVPLEFTPEAFQRIAYLTPLAWVMDGYKDILVRGQGVAAMGTAVFILLSYAIGLFVLAVWRFRFD